MLKELVHMVLKFLYLLFSCKPIIVILSNKLFVETLLTDKGFFLKNDVYFLKPRVIQFHNVPVWLLKLNLTMIRMGILYSFWCVFYFIEFMLNLSDPGL